MKYAATNYLGSTPARSYQSEKLICVNLDSFFSFPEEIRRFIVLHEKGHIIHDTDSEIKADNYAFSRMSGTFAGANRWSILAISRVLPFTTKEQYLRLLNMYENALLRENYELTGSPAYEYEDLKILKQQAEIMPDDQFGSGAAMDTAPMGTPIGPMVEIAHAAWTKSVMGLPLTGYDMTILDKYPIPEDFEAYEIDPEEITGEAENQLSDKMEMAESWLSAKMKSPHFWCWVIGGALLLILLLRKQSAA